MSLHHVPKFVRNSYVFNISPKSEHLRNQNLKGLELNDSSLNKMFDGWGASISFVVMATHDICFNKHPRKS